MNILVTGGTSGLGKATVELLAQNDSYQVFFTYLNTEEYREAAKLIMDEYPNSHAMALNFCNDKEVDKFCEWVKATDIDVLVNSAYVGTPQSEYFYKIKAEDFLKSFQVNLIPTIMITQAAIEVMRKKKFGKIINIITSYVMNLPPTGFATYVGNKAYLEKMSDVINKEYVKFNITSNCILPEFMNTGFGNVDPRLVEQAEATHPLKKLLVPEEVAQIVKFFVEASQQVNGVKLPINAAMYINN